MLGRTALCSSRTRVSALHELISCASGFFPTGLCAFFGTEVPGQITQKSVAIGVGDDGSQAFHLFELGGPLLAGHMLLGNARGVVTLRARGFDLGCMGSGRSGLPGALGACALARVMDANRKIAGNIRSNKQDPPDSVLSSQNWIFGWLWALLFFCFGLC